MTIFTDGGSRGNPGPAASAFVAYGDAGNMREKRGIYLGTATNNVAEYRAVILALEWTKEKASGEDVFFQMDSQLVAHQLNGIYKIKEENLHKLWLRIRELVGERESKVTFGYVPRERNKEADKLVNETLDKEISRR